MIEISHANNQIWRSRKEFEYYIAMRLPLKQIFKIDWKSLKAKINIDREVKERPFCKNIKYKRKIAFLSNFLIGWRIFLTENIKEKPSQSTRIWC